jgi:hypothetical protein
MNKVDRPTILVRNSHASGIKGHIKDPGVQSRRTNLAESNNQPSLIINQCLLTRRRYSRRVFHMHVRSFGSSSAGFFNGLVYNITILCGNRQMDDLVA